MLEIINRCLSGILMPSMMLSVGIYFAIKLGFFYIFHPIKTIKSMLSNQKGGFKSLTIALAGTLGIGNIAGVSSALIMGGPGSVFWMWLSALAAMSLKYSEVFLAVKYRRKKNGVYYGGAPYYINDGLGKKTGAGFAKTISCIFAFLCVANSLTTGNLVQVSSVSSLAPTSNIVFGIIFTACVFFVILGGVKRIGSLTFTLIPVLSLGYVLLSVYIILSDLSEIPSIFKMIFEGAFSMRSASSGVIGYGIGAAIRYGVSRGVLSNEAGCGTAPTAHASSDSKSAHGQGCLGILEVFADTILLCTLTAFVILLSGKNLSGGAMELVVSSYEQYAGKLGRYAIIISSMLFAFATVACQFYYGDESLSYLTDSKRSHYIYTAVFCLVSIVSSVIPMSLMWQISDLVIGTMTVFHLICLLFLFTDVTKISHF